MRWSYPFDSVPLTSLCHAICDTRARSDARDEARPPARRRRGREAIPLPEGVGVAHGRVAPAAQRDEIRERERPALALGRVVPDLKVKHRDAVGAPPGRASVAEDRTKVLAPDLLAERLWDGRFRTRSSHYLTRGAYAFNTPRLRPTFGRSKSSFLVRMTLCLENRASFSTKAYTINAG